MIKYSQIIGGLKQRANNFLGKFETLRQDLLPKAKGLFAHTKMFGGSVKKLLPLLANLYSQKMLPKVHNYVSLVKKLLSQARSTASSRLRTISWTSPKTIGIALAIALAISGVTFYLSGTDAAAYVLINGQKIGLVSSEGDGRELIDAFLSQKGQPAGKPAKTHDKIEFQNTRVQTADLLNKTLDAQGLEGKLSYYVDGVELGITDVPVAYLPSQEDADKVLKDYQDFYTKPSETNKVTSAEFVENVSVKPVETQPEQVMSADKALEMLTAGKTTSTEYTVQPNDSWWLIARKNDMKTKEVLAGNPGATEDTPIKPGQKIKLVKTTPYLTVTSTGIYTGEETIPFDVVTKTDYNLASGRTVIKQYGNDGSKTVTYSYVQQNGKTIKKEVLSEKVNKQPVTQIVAKGPVAVTVGYVSRGSGTVSGLGWPLSGRISSYYGYRNRGFHTGIDIIGDVGEPFVAAGSGTVVAAGWEGGYGKMILIDHGNGVMTRYGHATKILVSPGQYVSQGQTIGLVGSTGRSTGPHLHFELIINGDTVNPLSYFH